MTRNSTNTRARLALCAILALGALSLLVLSGCNGVQTADEKKAKGDLSETLARYRPGGVRPALPTLTDNSTLDDLLQYALLNDPRAEAAFYEWSASVSSITVARSQPDPMLTFGLTIAGGVPSLAATLMSDPGANWPGPGKLPLKADAAYADALKKRAAFEGELLGTALAVKRAYYQTWVLEEQILWTREVLVLVGNVEEVARERLAVGKATQQDVLRAQIERERLKNMLANFIDQRTTVSARLRSALGVGPQEALPNFKVQLDPSAADFTEASLLDTAYERNPKLKEMRGEVSQAIALYQLARKSNVPDYSWGIGAGVGPGPVSIMPSFGITLPIWRDKIEAEIAQGQSGVGAAKAKLSAEQLDLAVRFAESAYAWREADRTVELYGRELLPRAKGSFDSARGGYVGGMTAFADVLDAARTLHEYHVDYAQALGQREMTLAEMSLVILGRWPENIQPILTEARHDQR